MAQRSGALRKVNGNSCFRVHVDMSAGRTTATESVRQNSIQGQLKRWPERGAYTGNKR